MSLIASKYLGYEITDIKDITIDVYDRNLIKIYFIVEQKEALKRMERGLVRSHVETAGILKLDKCEEVLGFYASQQFIVICEMIQREKFKFVMKPDKKLLFNLEYFLHTFVKDDNIYTAPVLIEIKSRHCADNI